jgi:hypothetical protein
MVKVHLGIEHADSARRASCLRGDVMFYNPQLSQIYVPKNKGATRSVPEFVGYSYGWEKYGN